jgi:hypothetical protein
MPLAEKVEEGLGQEWVRPYRQTYPEIDPATVRPLSPSRAEGATGIMASKLGIEAPQAYVLLTEKGIPDLDKVLGADVTAAADDLFIKQFIKDEALLVRNTYRQFYGLPEFRADSIADRFREQIARMKDSDRRVFKAIDNVLGLTRKAINELAPDAPPAVKKVLALAEITGQPVFIMPDELAKSSPRFASKKLEFQSDLDRAAYILANDRAGKPSKAAAKFREALTAAGLDPEQVAAHGRLVKKAVKEGARDTSAETVVVPPQTFGGDTPQLPTADLKRRMDANAKQIDDLTKRSLTEGCDT